MLYTLADARRACGRFVESGTAKPTIVDQRVNEALERLLDITPLEGLLRVMRFCTQGRSFALPHNAEKVVRAQVNGVAARVFGRAYQFLDAGPGDDAFRSQTGTYSDLEDLGDDWALMYDLPAAFVPTGGTTCIGNLGWSLAAFSTAAADADKTLTLRGFTPGGQDFTEALVINRWHGGEENSLQGHWGSQIKVSANLFAGLDRVVVPEVSAAIQLFAVDTATEYLYFLATYHPSVRRPQFRRYRITNHCPDGVANVLAQVQLRHVPLVLDDDILPVNSVQAVKLAVIAIREENSGKLEAAQQAMASALQIVAKRDEANTMTHGTPVIIDSMRRWALQPQHGRTMIM